MKNTPAGKKKLLRELNAKLKTLQTELVLVKKSEGKDDYIDVKTGKNQARFERIKKPGEVDRALGKFYVEVHITAKQEAVYVPLSIASGKKTAGLMYQIEGTSEGRIATAHIKVRGKGVSQVTLGTLLYAKITAGATAEFQIHIMIRGNFGKTYKIVFTRINYKRRLTDARYEQYLKEIHTDSVKFSR